MSKETIEELEERIATQRESRRVFLKAASPTEILDWIMRSPDAEAKTQAYCAKALLENEARRALEREDR